MRKDSTTFKLEMAFGCLIALLAGVSWLGISRHYPLSEGMVLAAIGLALCIAVFTTRRLKREMAGRESAQDAIHGLNENLEKKVAERTEELKRSAEELKAEMTERLATEESSRRLAAIVESSDDAIIAAALNGLITDWNAGAERMFGYTRGEMIGKPVSLITPHEHSREPLECQEKLLKGVSGIRLESERIRSDGRRIQVAVSVSPIVNRDGQMVGTSAILRDITDRKYMEDALRRSEAGFRSVVQNSPFGIVRTTPGGRILQANPALVRMLGYSSEEEMLDLDMADDIYRRPEERAETIAWSASQNSVQGVELEWRRKDGTTFSVRCDMHGVLDAEGRLAFFESFVEDITQNRELELQLRQRQKMEAIGVLAGGVAHDFNNLLGVISGYAEMVSEQMDPASKPHGFVQQIRKAADRAAALTRQLLAFSRQQVLEVNVLSINSIVEEMLVMLPRLLGEDVELQSNLAPEIGAVKADQGQIERVILNLAVNARDAMPGGGKLTISTEQIRIDSESAPRIPSMATGDYVLLSVCDTGTGMDQQTQAHIFEPFFTTKERGRGTGLGLATVYGFVKQIGGYIWVESAPGAGSTFFIYLPVTAESFPKNSPAAPAADTGRSAGTLLLVEDEDSLRGLTRNILEQNGYTVLEACNGAEAVEIARSTAGPIDLLLTDMVMPGMNGRAVAEKVTRLHPEIRVAFMSGYTGFGSGESINLNVAVIAKPFTRDVLLQKLSEAMDMEQRPV
jgi:PAS domain S-box-containing protein